MKEKDNLDCLIYCIENFVESCNKEGISVEEGIKRLKTYSYNIL